MHEPESHCGDGSELTRLLSRYVQFAFDNEEAFFKCFIPDAAEYMNKVELIEFYMSGSYCRLVYQLPSGKLVTELVYTREFVEWVDAR